ncbi:MAG: NAD-dependent epimerase/dehydratase family protein, partial [Candidatus Hadarchaeales archaeon]
FFLGRRENLAPFLREVELVEGSVMDAKLLHKLTKNVDVIFHQAAASSSPMFLKRLEEPVSVNVIGFIRLLEAARENGVKRVVHASTSSIYGNNPVPWREDMKVEPPNFYAASKLACEHLGRLYSQEYGLETVALRYMSVYGPRERSKGEYANLVSQFLWWMREGKRPVVWGDGTQTRDLVYVKDVVKANLLAAKAKKISGEVINVGTGKETSLNELVEILNEMLGTNLKPKYVKIPVKNYIFRQRADLRKAEKLLGYRPSYSLREGIREILEHG